MKDVHVSATAGCLLPQADDCFDSSVITCVDRGKKKKKKKNPPFAVIRFLNKMISNPSETS